MPGTPRRRFAAVLEHRYAGFAIVALGVLLTLPAVSSGFMSDDHLLLGALEGRWLSSPPWYDLYDLIGRAVPEQIAHGELPWWTAPHAKLHLVRPLPSALLGLDHALFGDAAFGYHLHSMAWFAALLLLARAFFLRVLTRPTATLALFLFALSPNFALSSRWIAARHLIVAAVAAATGLLLLAASETRPRRRWFAALAFAVGLAASEAGLGGLALWAAYEVLGPKPGASERRAVRAVWPVLLGITYLALYARVGGGTRDIDAYVNPLSHPLGFARALLHHVPMLIGNALWLVESALGTLWPGPVMAAGIVGALLFAVAATQTSSSVPAEDRAALRWLVPGAVIGILGLAGGVPGGRELAIVGLGFAPLVASLVLHGWRRLPNGRTPWLSRSIVAPLVAMHIVVGPIAALGIWRFARQSRTKRTPSLDK